MSEDTKLKLLSLSQELDNLFPVIGAGKLAVFREVLNYIRAEGIDPDKLLAKLNFIEEEIATVVAEDIRTTEFKHNVVKPLCPICQSQLSVNIILVEQGKNNLYGYKTIATCTNEECNFEEFSVLEPIEWINNFLRGKEDGNSN